MRRRSFMQGCCAAIAATCGARLTNMTYAAGGQNEGEILLVVFLRGGMDALSFLSPYADSNYHIARANLALGDSDVIDLNGYFGLHPAAERLKELYDQQHLAFIPACGLPGQSRSHFEAQEDIEHGGRGAYGEGWLAKHLSAYPSDSIFQAISHGSNVAASLDGHSGALSLSGADGFTIDTDWREIDDTRRALRMMYGQDPELRDLALRTLDATDVIDFANPGDYTPGNGIEYPNSSFADALSSVAQVIRLDLGLQAATIDLGGWDTHRNQANNGSPATGQYADRVRQLSEGLHAFWSDMSDYHGRLTVFVMSEFGRRLKENDNTGTDHGHGGTSMVLNANLQPGGIFGQWPGLGYDQLFEHVDVAITTDYRTVLGEILQERFGVTDPSAIFSDFTMGSSLGLLSQNGVSTATAAAYGG